MVPVAEENNIEVLRAYALWLEAKAKGLAAENAKLKDAKEASKQTWIDEGLRDQLSRLQEKYYGRGRESLGSPREDRPQGHPKQQLLLHGERNQKETKLEKPKRLPSDNRFFTYKMSERELAKESEAREISSGHEAWEEIEGLYQEHYEITVHERVYVETLHRQAKYRLRPEHRKDGEKETIVTAPGPAKVRAGSKYSIDFAVAVVCDKYEHHMPLERQRRKMAAAGLDVDVKTLYGLCEAVAGHCEAVAEKIKRDVLEGFCAVHVDESPWPIAGLDRKTYMWVLSSNRGAYYRFEPTRSGQVASRELLAGYEGSIIVDGYGGYNGVKKESGIRVGQCWSHARREFYERIGAFPKEATEAIKIIDELFAIERKATSFEELARLRKTESKNVVVRLYKWLLAERPKHFAGSGLRKAIDYCLKFWSELTLFLKDLSMPLSNNDAERALRHVVMGRKNFLGSKTIDGADVAASLYTVIESAKRSGLQPAEYLKYLIDARWFGDELKTPYELSLEKFGPNPRVTFPPKTEWQIA